MYMEVTVALILCSTGEEKVLMLLCVLINIMIYTGSERAAAKLALKLEVSVDALMDCGAPPAIALRYGTGHSLSASRYVGMRD